MKKPSVSKKLNMKFIELPAHAESRIKKAQDKIEKLQCDQDDVFETLCLDLGILESNPAHDHLFDRVFNGFDSGVIRFETEK